MEVLEEGIGAEAMEMEEMVLCDQEELDTPFVEHLTSYRY